MSYCTLTSDCLNHVYNQWVDYYNARLNALKYIVKAKKDDWYDEGNSDLRYGRYNADSVQRWYDNNCREADEWFDKCLRGLKDEDNQFEFFFKQMQNDYYTEDDYDYVIIYDFSKKERRREYLGQGKRSVTVRFVNTSHWYEWKPYRRDLSFDAGKPYFTPWR